MPVYPDIELAPGDPGSLLVQPYGYEFRDLLFGSGTDIITERVEGLLSLPNVNMHEEDKEFEHGTHPGVSTMSGRKIVFDIKAVGTIGIDIEQKLALLRKTFQLPRLREGRASEPFVFWRPGEPKKLCNVRCTRRDFASRYETARGIAEGSVELYAADPLIYSLEEQEAVLTLADSAASGQATVVQSGDFVDGAWPLLTLTGPATNPVIGNADDDNRQIRLDVILGAGDTAVIDVLREIVWVNGIRQSTVVRSDNQWWALLPGDNSITYNRSAGAATSTLTINYRNVWQ